MFDIGAVVARHAQTSIVSKVVGHAHGAQGSVVASGAIGGTVAVAGQASVWPRAFHKRCGHWICWNVPVIVFMAQRRPTWYRNNVAAIRAVGANNTFPRIDVVVGVV